VLLTTPAFPNRSAIGTDQLAKLRSLLSTLSSSNPFYSSKLQAAGVDPKLSSFEQFFASALFTRKQELIEDQRDHPPYGSNLTWPIERYTRFSQTSGTSGKPMRWLDTPESWAWMLDNWERVYGAAGITAADTIFFAFSFGPFLGFWTAFEAGARMCCLCIPGGGMRSAARLRAILDNGATVLCSTPTYAIRLAEVAAEENIDLAAGRVRRIVVAGEPGGSIAATRAYIEKLWPGSGVIDHHGMTETGPVSYGCPNQQNVLHVIESAYIPEVIDPSSGQAVPPGATGELVLTNLGRTGSPLVRYRTCDLVQRAEKPRCECGSYELALNGGILGRTDDMVVVRGVNVYPSAVEDIVRGLDGIAEYRVEIRRNHALTDLRVQVEPLSQHRDTGGLSRRLEVALGNAFGLRIPVSCVPPGTLPRFEMKAERWIRL
jgi:phenylacetate-CoA ligase